MQALILAAILLLQTPEAARHAEAIFTAQVEKTSAQAFYADLKSRVAGAGRTELVEAIFGAQPADEGRVFLNGARLDSTKPHRAVGRGLGLLTEDRKRTGLCLNLTAASGDPPWSADCQFQGRLVVRTWLPRDRRVPPHAMSVDACHLGAWANDG